MGEGLIVRRGGSGGKPEGSNVWRKSLLHEASCRVYATVQARNSTSQTYKINLEGDSSLFTFDVLVGKKMARITNPNAGVYADYAVKSTSQATETYSNNSSSSNKNATWNASAMTYQILASWSTDMPISNLLDFTIKKTEELGAIFVVDNDVAAYPDGAYHTDGYYYDLLASVASANVMMLSDGAVATVQDDYRTQVEGEVSQS